MSDLPEFVRPIPRGGEVVRRCTFCDSPHVNHWKSWNEVGEWTCDDCTPTDPCEVDES